MVNERGFIQASEVLRLTDLGLERRAPLDHVIVAFRKVAEGPIIARWVQFPTGVLLFVMVPGDKESGEFYVYDRSKGVFYLLTVNDGKYGGYRIGDFDPMVQQYGLYGLAERPWLLGNGCGSGSFDSLANSVYVRPRAEEVPLWNTG